MERERIYAQDVDGAIKQICYYIQRRRGKNVIYFDGWSGFGAAPVLKSMAQELRSIKAKKTPSELCFDKVIYIDCSAWGSRRQMQRKIAEELQLDLGTMAMFDKQDEEDDFNGVDYGSRDVLKTVSQVILSTLFYTKLVMIFLNGSGDEIDINRFGINPDLLDHLVVWTFKRHSLTIHSPNPSEMARELRYTHSFLHTYPACELANSDFVALLRGEAADIVALLPCIQGIDLTVVTDCCLYELFLQHWFYRAIRFYWSAHAPSYWLCDGIIEGNGAKEISSALHQEIHWECNDYQLEILFGKMMADPEAPFGIFFVHSTPLLIKGPYRWICVISEGLIIPEVPNEAILERLSSLFVALGMPYYPQALPDGFLKHCSKLGVLTLCSCAFSFVSPPFLHCHELRFLGLDHCTHDNTSEGENNANWTWLQNLWVLDLRYTEWHDILSQENIDNMDKLRELNVEGFMCWQLATRLHGKLIYLQRLRIIQPMHKADTSIDSSSNNLHLDKAELEILDLSGNTDMKNLSVSSSMARRLQTLILDGCDGLENVVLPDRLPSSLRSFSFDAYGLSTHRTSSFNLSSKQMHSSDAEKTMFKTSKISLQSCTQLENFVVRGLPNLEELDLSGSAIKVLDFETMLINVPGLKRLILLGCEHLRAVKWGSFDSVRQLELLCVDTQPWSAHGSTRPCLAKQKSSNFQLQATLADARLARSLCTLLEHYTYGRFSKNIYFNIHVTSSVKSDGVVRVETTREGMIEPSSQQHQVQGTIYCDASFKISDAPMMFFPQPPTEKLGCHIEISDESRGLEGELLEHFDNPSLAELMRWYTESLHVHDASNSVGMCAGYSLEWCRMERCPNLETVFSTEASGGVNQLQTIWASHLPMARCIWSKGSRSSCSFKNLQHMHLRSCARLQFALPVWVPSFPNLKTLHIVNCGNLTHIFVLDEEYPEEIAVHGLPFPKLTTIHLHDLPKLKQMSEVKMLAPALETIKIQGCFGLRRLPTVARRKPGIEKPIVEMEKGVWDSLEWDGLAADHHPDLFEHPVHSRYYRRSRVLRGSVLR